jgi:hypothetical protein
VTSALSSSWSKRIRRLIGSRRNLRAPTRSLGTVVHEDALNETLGARLVSSYAGSWGKGKYEKTYTSFSRIRKLVEDQISFIGVKTIT